MLWGLFPLVVICGMRGEVIIAHTAAQRWTWLIMSSNIRICIICGRAIYDRDPKIASKPRKGKTVYAHTKCVYGGAPNGKTKESR